MATSATTIAAGTGTPVCHAAPVTPDHPSPSTAAPGLPPWRSTTEAAEYGSRLLTGPTLTLRASSEADLALVEQW